MRFDVITIFPDFFTSFKNEALIARAQKKKLISIKAHNLRDWTTDNHKTVDDRPYGGGAGMVLKPEPILKAVNSLQLKIINYKLKTIPACRTGRNYKLSLSIPITLAPKKLKLLVKVAGCQRCCSRVIIRRWQNGGKSTRVSYCIGA